MHKPYLDQDNLRPIFEAAAYRFYHPLTEKEVFQREIAQIERAAGLMKFLESKNDA